MLPFDQHFRLPLARKTLTIGKRLHQLPTGHILWHAIFNLFNTY